MDPLLNLILGYLGVLALGFGAGVYCAFIGRYSWSRFFARFTAIVLVIMFTPGVVELGHRFLPLPPNNPSASWFGQGPTIVGVYIVAVIILTIPPTLLRLWLQKRGMLNVLL